MVINPLTGRPARMTLVMFFDFKSDMPLGWEIMPAENILTIASALRRTILMLGKFFDFDGYIPKVVYLDNGRAFRAKYFRGVKDFKDTILPGLFAKLKIETMYATPYHGQSKTIERWFKTLGELERKLPAYTGTNIAGKPAMLLRNEKLHKRLFENTPITLETLDYNLKIFIQEYAETPHQDGRYKGLCPAEIFMNSIEKIKQDERYKSRLISKQELIYLMLSDESRVIGKNGIRFRGNYYWNEEMPRFISNRITIKYDLWDDSEIIVLDEKERFLFKAVKDDIRYHPAARLLGSENDLKLLTEALENKQRIKKQVVEEFKLLVERFVNSPNPSNRGGFEIPAGAGMTDNGDSRFRGNDNAFVGMTDCGDSRLRGNDNVSAGMTVGKRSKEASVTLTKKKMQKFMDLLGVKGYYNPIEELMKGQK
jgi:putative transposase